MVGVDSLCTFGGPFLVLGIKTKMENTNILCALCPWVTINPIKIVCSLNLISYHDYSDLINKNIPKVLLHGALEEWTALEVSKCILWGLNQTNNKLYLPRLD